MKLLEKIGGMFKKQEKQQTQQEKQFDITKEYFSKKKWDLYQTVPLPLDQQGFVKAFNIDEYDPEQVRVFFDTYGLVIFRDILTEEEVQATISDLWKQVQQVHSSHSRPIKRKDPQSWKFIGMFKSFGFVGNQPINQLQMWKNRVNPRVYKSFKDLYEISSGKPLNEPLLNCLDRGSMMRPTKKHPEWKTHDFYHFDIDPWHWTQVKEECMHNDYNQKYAQFSWLPYMMGQGNYMPYRGHTKIAGVLALSDTNQNSGGFEAACGFQNYMKKWCETVRYQCGIEEDKQLLKTFQRVFLRKGSLMLFSRQLPHNIYPNNSSNFRYAQYLRMMPESSLMLTPQMKEKRKALIKSILPKKLEITEICKQTLMLD